MIEQNNLRHMKRKEENLSGRGDSGQMCGVEISLACGVQGEVGNRI
jgi:hypothetical protein